MTEEPYPDFILVGPQKCATTWIYKCLDEHPDVFVPDSDSIHYFDMNYHKSEKWYLDHFSGYDGEQVVGETTPSYIRDPNCPRRIHEMVPDGKILFSLRNPVDRAFSHYWHEKEKSKIQFEFREVFTNYDLFQNWVETGQYYYHLQRYMEYYNDSIGVFFFDDLINSNADFIREIYEFVGVDPNYTPSVIDKKVNQAWNRFDSDLLNRLYRGGFNFILQYAPTSVRNSLRPIHDAIQEGKIPLLAGQSEYERGMDEKTRRELETYFIEDAMKLSRETDRDLRHWFQYHNLDM